MTTPTKLALPVLAERANRLLERVATYGIPVAGDFDEKPAREIEKSGGWKEDVEPVWEELNGRIETGRAGHTAVVHGSMICALCGDASPDTVEVYDTAAQVWNELDGGGMSEARRYSTSAVYKEKLYVVGGRNRAYEKLRSVEVYDFATQQWSLLPTEMTTARSEHGAVVCKDKLYVVGGEGVEYTILASVDVYDFATETWSILPAPMPQPRAYINSAVVQHTGKVYVVGGRSSDLHGNGETDEDLQSVAVYDTAAEEWSVLPANMLVYRAMCAVVLCGALFKSGSNLCFCARGCNWFSRVFTSSVCMRVVQACLAGVHLLTVPADTANSIQTLKARNQNLRAWGAGG
jgi:hypothetical protein